MLKNQIIVIQPYRFGGTWVFDDPNVGLTAEPFVSGIPEIIDHVLAEKKIDRTSRFRLLFSESPFPGSRQLERREPEFGGMWYRDVETGMVGWLCPALFRYFDVAPDNLFCSIELITTDD